ncbi:MAG TPA: glycosyltransferase [Bdellovibrionota bacterium]|nr:glycosyltransferase [Bdellovibrionota bacterium]
MSFDVLMSVYFREEAANLQRALESVWDEQTLKPDAIVIVKDGPLTAPLDEVIERWAQRLPQVVRIKALPKNLGLGPALTAGLELCQSEWVARMDSDDVSLPQRFAEQMAYLSQHPECSVLGAWIAEFDRDEAQSGSLRRVPTEHAEILKFSRWRSPINHPSVVFRRRDVLAEGSYHGVLFFEDYDLWTRLLARGYRFANLPRVLVKMRAGNAQLARRGGRGYFGLELSFLRRLRQRGILSWFDFVVAVVAKGGVRILPLGLRGQIYRTLLRKRVDGGTDEHGSGSANV